MSGLLSSAYFKPKSVARPADEFIRSDGKIGKLPPMLAGQTNLSNILVMARLIIAWCVVGALLYLAVAK